MALGAGETVGLDGVAAVAGEAGGVDVPGGFVVVGAAGGVGLDGAAYTADIVLAGCADSAGL